MLEGVLSERKVITVEVLPPRGPNLPEFLDKVSSYGSVFDGFNVPELVMRRENEAWINTFYVAVRMRERGLLAIPHMTCREHTRRSAISHILMGISGEVEDILVVRGDSLGIYSKEVFELDTIGMIKLVISTYLRFSGRKPTILVAADPNAPDLDDEIRRTLEKLEAGGEIVQTQPVFNMDKFEEFVEGVKRERPEVKILGGVLLLSDPRTVERLKKVVGLPIPEEVTDRLISSEDPLSEGTFMAEELSSSIIDVCDGVHMFPMGRLDVAAEVAKRIRRSVSVRIK